jgi:hypothetical protein
MKIKETGRICRGLRFAVTTVKASSLHLRKPVEQGDSEVAFELLVMDSHGFGL